jgi:tRNA-dihydrouridine synthase
MYKASQLAVKLGFDGVDINMGCPDKSVEKQGGGASLIKNPKLAQEIILSAMAGVKDAGSDIPVSVKTRVGYNKNEIETWLPLLLETNPGVVTVHARTRKELSLVPANWDYVKRAVEIRDEMSIRQAQDKKNKTLIFGNGDVSSIDDARRKYKESNCDGVMLGRKIFGNPWLFSGRELNEISIEEKLKVLVEHCHLFSKLLPHKSFAIMKKHFKAYVNGWDGAKELRLQLMETKNNFEVDEIIMNYLKNGLK